MNYSEIELLAPAGSTESLAAAVNNGANAVYLGTKDFNARARAKNFAYKELEIATNTLHKMGRKLYVTVNTVFEEWEINRAYNLLKYLSAIGVDGIIVQDLGILQMIKDNDLTTLPIHGSTQMNISTSVGANFLANYGVKRVVVSRELTFNEISNIVKNTTAEIEMFIHGALCISGSGICQFSSFFGGKSANRGQCTQACRRLYLDDNEKEGYYFSPKDLMLLENIPQIVEAGVASLKIEGRMKTPDYVGSVVSAYRYMLDNYQTDYKEALKTSKNILAGDLSRQKTTFFFNGRNSYSETDKKNNNEYPDFLNVDQTGELGLLIGNVSGITQNNQDLNIKYNTEIQLDKGDWVRIHNKAKDKSENFKIQEISEENNSKIITVTPKDNFTIANGDVIYLFKKNEKQNHYSSFIKFNLPKYHHPGIQDIAISHHKEIAKSKYNCRKLEFGAYIQINKFAQFFLIQAFKPRKIIFSLTRNNTVELLSNIQKITFNRADLIIELPPFLREDDVNWMEETIANLKKIKINTFIVNNVSELSYFKNDKECLIIAGQYLYTFNSYAIKWLLKHGVSYIIPPLEISKKNFYDLLDVFGPNLFILNIFTFPVLFNINANLQKHPDKLHDKKENQFFVIREKETTRVIPNTPFSLLDKQPLLNKNNIKKVIVNLCDISLSKSDYKSLVKKLATNENVEHFTRFNWNDGFYRNEETYKK